MEQEEKRAKQRENKNPILWRKNSTPCVIPQQTFIAHKVHALTISNDGNVSQKCGKQNTSNVSTSH